MFGLVLRPKIGVIMVDQKDPPGRQASNFTLVLKGLIVMDENHKIYITVHCLKLMQNLMFPAAELHWPRRPSSF